MLKGTSGWERQGNSPELLAPSLWTVALGVYRSGSRPVARNQWLSFAGQQAFTMSTEMGACGVKALFCDVHFHKDQGSHYTTGSSGSYIPWLKLIRQSMSRPVPAGIMPIGALLQESERMGEQRRLCFTSDAAHFCKYYIVGNSSLAEQP